MKIDRTAIERALARALRELDPASRVVEALPRAWATGPRSSPRVRIVAIGKAAPAMAAGAIVRLGSAVERCLVVTSDGTDDAALHAVAVRAGIASRVDVMRAAHPLPDARSVRAGNACLDAVAAENAAGAKILVLVSGGASALACAPAPGITLRAKRAITRAMLASGASIQDINVVRKHLSRIKGGGLARAAAPGALFTLVASDVIGGTASDVGSGPSVPDESSVSDARRLLKRFAPAFAGVPLVRTPAAKAGARARAKMVISPEELAHSMAALLDERARVLPPSQASVDELAAEYVALAERTRAPRIFVRAAEPSVEVTTRSGKRAGAGRGGRSTHLAALVGERLEQRRIGESARVVFAALASDGIDGSSDTGGAIVDGAFASRVAARLGEAALARSLARFDTGALHRALGTALPCRATGQNLADVHVLVVA